MVSPKRIMQIAIIGSLTLIILGQLIDEAFYRTAAAQTPNVTGVSATVLSLLGLIFLVAVLVIYASLI